MLSTGCGSNDNSGTLEINRSRQKSSDNSHNEHLALSVEIIENSPSSASEKEEDVKDEIQEDGPPQQEESSRDI